MNMHFKLSVLTLVALVGCHGRDTPRAPAAVAHTAKTDSGSATAAADRNLWCKDTTPHNPDPGKLVREYVRRDGTGEFLSSNTFWQSATECAGAGTGAAQVITSSTIDSLGVRADTARFAVTYHFLGDLLPNPPGFNPRVRTETDTFLVLQRKYGWRIVGEHGVPILMRNAAQRFWPLTRADLARLDSAARAAPN